MQFKVFPCNANKIPLMRGWQEAATTDPQTIALWQQLYNGKLAAWGITTGPTNDILVLDIDTKEGRNGFSVLQRYGLEIPHTLAQRTPTGGAHYFFRYPKDGKHYGNRANMFAEKGEKTGVDVRGSGGYVCFYGADLSVPIADAPAWLFQDMGRTVYQHDGTAVKVAPELAEGIIKESLDRIVNAADGERNNTLNTEAFRIGQLVAGESITRDYAEMVLMNAATACGMKGYEITATIRSGLEGGTKKPLTSPFGNEAPVPQFTIPLVPDVPATPARWTPEYFTRYDLMNTSNLKKPQLFEDWSTEDIHITTADGGTGKTTLMIFEAICLALGERFLGFDCKQRGKTLFITGEDTAKKLAAMMGQIIRQMGLFEDKPGNNEKIELILSSIVIKKDSDLCLITKDKQHFIHPNLDAMTKIMQAVEDIKPKKIVFDPISSFWGSEAALNDMNKAVSKFMGELVDRSGACVEMINHMGKQSSANKDMTQFAGRGGTGLPSHARVSRVLRSVSEEEYMELTNEALTEKQSAMMCNVNKFSDGSPLYNKPFLILRDGFLFSRKNLTQTKAREAEKNLSDIERVFSFVKEQRVLDRYPTRNVIVGHFATCGDSLSEARVKRAIDMLQYQGHMGEMIKAVDNPDVTVKDKVYVITDGEGRES